MKVIFKSLVFIILTGVLAFPLVKIMYVHFRVVAHRTLMHGADPGHHHLDTLNLTVAELRRIRLDERELIYKGKRYDIRTERLDGDTVRLTAFHDWYEQFLLQEIIELHHQGKLPDQQVSRMLYPDWIYQKLLQPSDPQPGIHLIGFPEHPARLLNTPWLMWYPPPEEMI